MATTDDSIQEVTMPAMGWRILGFGADESIGVRGQAMMRQAGLRATILTVADDETSDMMLIDELSKDTFDGVVIGGFISGQDPSTPPTRQTTLWFNRLINIIAKHAPTSKVILAIGPADAMDAIGRVLGEYTSH